jgi:hypothetical protein
VERGHHLDRRSWRSRSRAQRDEDRTSLLLYSSRRPVLLQEAPAARFRATAHGYGWGMAEPETEPVRDFRVGLYAIERGRALEQALEDLARELPGGRVGRPDDAGILEVTIEASSFDHALTRVWDAVAAAGVDDQLAFAEHPDLPDHWRAKAFRAS